MTTLADLEGAFVSVRLEMYTGDDELGGHVLTTLEHSPELTKAGVRMILQYTIEALDREEPASG